MKMMLIGLDEARMIKDGCDVANFWEQIDALFLKQKWTKEPQTDGNVLYVGNPESDNLLAELFIACKSLSQSEAFAKYVTKWLEYDNDDDESLPFAEDDFLASERSYNPIFMKGEI